MNPQTCNSCGGVYSPAGLDGGRYFHACPSAIKAADRRDENLTSPLDPTPKAAGKGVTPGVAVITPSLGA